MSALRLARGFTGRAQDRQVRRLLSRPRRLPAGEGGLRRADVRPADRRPACRRRSPAQTHRRCRTTISTRSRRRSTANGDEIACDHRRADRRQHELRRCRAPASSRGCARCATRHGAVLIFDEVMTGFRVAPARRAGAVRHHAGPDDARQGDRRRHAGRRVRRHGATIMERSRRSARSTRPARCPAIRSRWRRASRRSPPTEAPGFYERAGDHDARARRWTCSGREASRRRRSRAQAVGGMFGLYFAADDPRFACEGDGLRHGALQPLLPRDARCRRLPRAVGVRGGLRVRRAHGRRHRADGRRGEKSVRIHCVKWDRGPGAVGRNAEELARVVAAQRQTAPKASCNSLMGKAFLLKRAASRAMMPILFSTRGTH